MAEKSSTSEFSPLFSFSHCIVSLAISLVLEFRTVSQFLVPYPSSSIRLGIPYAIAVTMSLQRGNPFESCQFLQGSRSECPIIYGTHRKRRKKKNLPVRH